MLPREDSSDNAPEPVVQDSSISEVAVQWIGNVYKYTDPKLNVLTVLLRHIGCISAAYPGTIQVFDAFIKQTEVDIVSTVPLR